MKCNKLHLTDKKIRSEFTGSCKGILNAKTDPANLPRCEYLEVEKTFQGKSFKIFQPTFSKVLTFLIFKLRPLDRYPNISD